MEKIDQLKIRAFDLAKQLEAIQEDYTEVATELTNVFEEIKECQK